MKVVDKLWGKEYWLVNNNAYCGKILELDSGYSSSTHCHKKKLETFYCLEGSFTLMIEGHAFQSDSSSEPATIAPNTKHSFYSKTGARILEVSTTHDEADVYRDNESHKLKSYCFDIDGTICTDPRGDYETAVPFPDVIRKINNLHDEGYEIIFHTARGSTTGIDWTQATRKQLVGWGVKYDRLITGKPTADFYIDDKAINVKDWDEVRDI